MSVSVVLLSQFYSEMGSAYGVPISDQFGRTYDVLQNLTAITDTQEDAVRKGSVTDASLITSTTNGVLVAIDFFLSTPALLRAVLSDLINFDIPQVVVNGIMVIFISILILMIITLIMKVRAEV